MSTEAPPIRSLDDVRALVAAGAPDLAVLEGIRAYARGSCSSAERIALLNDLAVLRHGAGDERGALRILRRAAIESSDPLVRDNLEALEALAAPPPEASRHDPREVGPGAANPWVVEGLRALDRAVELKGRTVLELGGSTPAESVRRFAPGSWTAVDLAPVGAPADGYRLVGGDAARLPIGADRFDAALSVCAFEHIDDVSGTLAEVRRVLRPGALFFTQFAPIWSCATGHHVWIRDADRVVTFNDAVVPDWVHLVLSEEELLGFLRLTLDKSLAERVAAYPYRSRYINRRCEAEFQRAFESSGLEIVSRSEWGGAKRPSVALAEELARRWPGGGNFGSCGIRVLLRKPA